ncbi:MAG: FMN-binding protein [Treponema sp.]|jgi:uncharacterized protein with FMN-binding domain|nr:FMN-binding protein [Treponema sp.]
MKGFYHLAALGAVFAVLPVIFGGCFSASFRNVQYKPGVYEGSGRGFRSSIPVRITVSHSGIEDIEILDHKEDEAIGGAALEELRELILEYGLLPDTAELDAVSGATASCKGFLEALENALLKAR